MQCDGGTVMQHACLAPCVYIVIFQHRSKHYRQSTTRQSMPCCLIWPLWMPQVPHAVQLHGAWACLSATLTANPLPARQGHCQC